MQNNKTYSGNDMHSCRFNKNCLICKKPIEVGLLFCDKCRREKDIFTRIKALKSSKYWENEKSC